MPAILLLLCLVVGPGILARLMPQTRVSRYGSQRIVLLGSVMVLVAFWLLAWVVVDPQQILNRAGPQGWVARQVLSLSDVEERLGLMLRWNGLQTLRATAVAQQVWIFWLPLAAAAAGVLLGLFGSAQRPARRQCMALGVLLLAGLALPGLVLNIHTLSVLDVVGQPALRNTLDLTPGVEPGMGVWTTVAGLTLVAGGSLAIFRQQGVRPGQRRTPSRPRKPVHRRRRR